MSKKHTTKTTKNEGRDSRTLLQTRITDAVESVKPRFEVDIDATFTNLPT